MKEYQTVSAYNETRTITKNHDDVLQYTDQVKKIAYHLHSRLPKTVLIEDLIQSGMVGLLEAWQRFDSEKMVNFKTFASLRIRGAMLDDMRKNSWVPRSACKNMRSISEAIKGIEKDTGKSATSAEIAQAIGVSMDEYSSMSASLHSDQLVSLDTLNEEMMPTENVSDPAELIEKEDTVQAVAMAMKNLPEREKNIMSLYYVDKLNFREIAEVMGLTEARISQLHGQAVARLQSRLAK